MGLRNFLRGRFLDTELGVLGEKLDQIEARLESLVIDASHAREKQERMIERVQKRLQRGRPTRDDLDGEDQRILDELRRRPESGEAW